MKKPKNNQRRSGQLGCGFVLSTGLLLIALLVINAYFVRTFFRTEVTGIDERIFQAAQFVLPILMIFIELWIYDLIVNRNRISGDKET
ncbi:MAG: hypothetical protein AB8B55_10790 [Mariniblastus sp.]